MANPPIWCENKRPPRRWNRREGRAHNPKRKEPMWATPVYPETG